MNALTKDQRHEVYKRALEIFNDNQDPLCCIIDQAANELYGMAISDDTAAEFIEFGTFRPEGKQSYQSWWAADDDNSRLNCLNQCIELSKPDQS